MPDPTKVTKRKTRVIHKNCHPSFMEMLEYRMPLDAVRHKTLQVCTSKSRAVDGGTNWAGLGPGLTLTCGLGLVLHKPKARAHAGLIFGLSLQSRNKTHTQGQARPAKARARILQARSGFSYKKTRASICSKIDRSLRGCHLNFYVNII
jgi:hypothetical protein